MQSHTSNFIMILMGREALGCNLGHIVHWVTRIEERKAKNSVFQCRGNIDNNHLRVKFGVKVELCPLGLINQHIVGGWGIRCGPISFTPGFPSPDSSGVEPLGDANNFANTLMGLQGANYSFFLTSVSNVPFVSTPSCELIGCPGEKMTLGVSCPDGISYEDHREWGYLTLLTMWEEVSSRLWFQGSVREPNESTFIFTVFSTEGLCSDPQVMCHPRIKCFAWEYLKQLWRKKFAYHQVILRFLEIVNYWHILEGRKCPGQPFYL